MSQRCALSDFSLQQRHGSAMPRHMDAHATIGFCCTAVPGLPLRFSLSVMGFHAMAPMTPHDTARTLYIIGLQYIFHYIAIMTLPRACKISQWLPWQAVVGFLSTAMGVDGPLWHNHGLSWLSQALTALPCHCH